MPAAPCLSDGAAEIGFAAAEGVTRLVHLYQSDPCRVLFPRPARDAPIEAALVTISGGVVGGDRLRFDLSAGPDARATVTSQAAEKIYRSAGPDSRIAVSVRAAAGSAFEWMPQETILFDRARLRRDTAIALEPGAALLTGEIVVFGRLARGERFAHGLLHDRWRVRSAGNLVWADALHLSGATAAALDNRFAFGGAVALATMLYAGAAADRLLPAVRDIAGSAADCRAAATVLGDLLIVRMLSGDAMRLRTAFAGLWSALRESALGFPAALPRVWHT